MTIAPAAAGSDSEYVSELPLAVTRRRALVGVAPAATRKRFGLNTAPRTNRGAKRSLRPPPEPPPHPQPQAEPEPEPETQAEAPPAAD